MRHVLAAVLVLALLAGCAKDASPSPSSERSPHVPSATATLSGSPSSKNGPAKVVRTLLADRARALLDGDRAGFVAPIDDSATSVRDQQRSLYDNVRGARPATWRYLVDVNSAQRMSHAGGDSWRYTVSTSYGFPGLESQPAVRTERVEVVDREDGWRITSITKTDDHTEPWDLGKATALRQGKVTVIGVGASRARLRGILELAATAVPRVDDVWDGDWARGVVVVVPKDAADAARLARSDSVTSLAAIATGASAADAKGQLRRWDRVVVNPDAWRTMNDTGKKVVLTHEMTHVATGQLGTVPLWVSEGFADYVGWNDVDLPMRQVAKRVAADVDRGDVPANFPTDSEFGSDEPDQAYEEAWLVDKYVTFRYGEDKLLDLYRAMAGRQGTSAAEQDAAVQATLHVSLSEFRDGWRAYVRSRLS